MSLGVESGFMMHLYGKWLYFAALMTRCTKKAECRGLDRIVRNLSKKDSNADCQYSTCLSKGSVLVISTTYLVSMMRLSDLGDVKDSEMEVKRV